MTFSPTLPIQTPAVPAGAPTVPSQNPHAVGATLTLAERSELERQYDGPITEAAIQDKIGQRGAYAPKVVAPTTPADLTAKLRFLRADRAFYAARVEEFDAEIAELQADRDRLYVGAEWDRKTRHIASMMRNRQSPADSVAYYDGLIARTEGEMAGTEQLAAAE